MSKPEKNNNDRITVKCCSSCHHCVDSGLQGFWCELNDRKSNIEVNPFDLCINYKKGDWVYD